MSTSIFRFLSGLLSLALVSAFGIAGWLSYGSNEPYWWAYLIGIFLLLSLLYMPLEALIDFFEALLVSPGKITNDDIVRWDREIDKHGATIKLCGFLFFATLAMWVAAEYGGWKPEKDAADKLLWWVGSSAALFFFAFGVNPTRLGKLERRQSELGNTLVENPNPPTGLRRRQSDTEKSS